MSIIRSVLSWFEKVLFFLLDLIITRETPMPLAGDPDFIQLAPFDSSDTTQFLPHNSPSFTTSVSYAEFLSADEYIRRNRVMEAFQGPIPEESRWRFHNIEKEFGCEVSDSMSKYSSTVKELVAKKGFAVFEDNMLFVPHNKSFSVGTPVTVVPIVCVHSWDRRLRVCWKTVA